MTIHSSKTEHHEGKATRTMPIFAELRPYLEAAWDQSDSETEHVITRYRSANSNLRTQLQRIIKRAELESWPKLFHNLRSTRQTELEEVFPSHVVCAWIGNSESIARKHYLQVTDDHFEKAAQNPAQYSAVSEGTVQKPKTENLSFTEGYETLRECTKALVEDRGLEPLTFWLPARRSPN